MEQDLPIIAYKSLKSNYFHKDYFLENLTQLLFYFLVYGGFYLKSNVGGRKKNKNKILFQIFFFLIQYF